MECDIGEWRNQECYTFATWDYVVFAGLFIVSGGIGMYFAFQSRNQAPDTEDYLLGGRKLSAYPVSLSMTASFMSAIAVLGLPAEFYLYGTMFWWFALAYLIMAIIVSEIYVPIFYKLQITSTYEYLEIRFNRSVRILATSCYLVASALYMGVVIYAPSLALNAVTGLGIWWSVVVTAAVCIIYTSLGGMKAVVWTDVFQCLVMWAGLAAAIIGGTAAVGGFENVWNLASDGGRVKYNEFDFNPKLRHSFWTITIGGTLYWTGAYGTSQTIAQRYVSCKSLGHAKLALYLNLIGLWIVLILVGLAGLVMYAYYAGCDPYTRGWVMATDQLMPYFVLEIFHDYPGIPGIFVCSAFSGTLSTISSGTNAMATVTVQDFILPFKALSPRQHLILSKVLVVIFGIICTLMAVVTSQLGSVLEVAFAVNGIVNGAMVGLFTLGMLLPWCNSYGAFAGLLSGLAVTTWVYIGSTVYPTSPENLQLLPRCTSMCNVTAGASCSPDEIIPTELPDSVTEQPTEELPGIANLYAVSYLYHNLIGFLTTTIVGMIVSFATGYQKPSTLPPATVHPFFDHVIFRWMPKKIRRALWCGVKHEKEDFLPSSAAPGHDSSFSYKAFDDVGFVEPEMFKTDNFVSAKEESFTTKF